MNDQVREHVALKAQACHQIIPTIILGSGASIPHGLPSMGQLSDFLIEDVSADQMNESEPWSEICENLANGDHLEAALEHISLPESLLQKIVRSTWECINRKDHEIYLELAKTRKPLPLGDLLKLMFRSNSRAINIITTNYDRLAEYACNSVDITFETGFYPGYIQSWSQGSHIQLINDPRISRRVSIWKVHGSLDWFKTDSETTLGLPVFSFPHPDMTAQIVTPGVNKFQKTHQDPFRSTINGSDSALDSASGILCIGYGFRDEHIHQKLIKRCRERDLPVVVIAKFLTDEAKAFLFDRAGPHFLGIEESSTGSRIYTDKYRNGAEIPHSELWSVSGYQTLVS